MHDIRAIRDNPEAFVAGWSSRGVDDAADLVARILALDVDLRAAQTTGQEALAKRNASDKSTTANAPAKKKGVNKVTYQRSSSEETTAERDRRMYRECKGMHNAGACRGYTR